MLDRRLLAGVTAALVASLPAVPVGAAPAAEAVAFVVSKSENRNQVHYAVRLDRATCAPDGASPVRPFWRMLERGPTAIEGLLGREEPAYGVASQVVIARGAQGGAVRVVLRAMPERPITIVAARDGDVCRVVATAVVDGAAARLERVHVELAWPFGVDHLLLVGARLVDARPVREKLRP